MYAEKKRGETKSVSSHFSHPGDGKSSDKQGQCSTTGGSRQGANFPEHSPAPLCRLRTGGASIYPSWAVLAVSHDRYFLDKMAHQIFEVGEEGQVTRYSGNYSDYLDKRQAASAPIQEEKAEKKPAGKPARQKKLKFTFKEQREYDTIEADIAALEARITQREGEMLACGSDYGKLQDLTKEQEADQAALEEKMERWLYLTDLAERITAQEG